MEIKPDPENQVHAMMKSWRYVGRVLRGIMREMVNI